MTEDTEPTTIDDGAQTNDHDDEGPEPCWRLFATPENGGTMYTCSGCGCSMSEKWKFRELERCQR